MRLVIVLLVWLLPSMAALAAGKMYYGSRAGMTVTVVAKSGIGSDNAVIRTRHTRDDAVAFCREYVGIVSETCIRQEMATSLSDEIKGNCVTGRFTNFFGEDHQFLGEIKSPKDDIFAKYALRNLATGQLADGSSASGYSTNMRIFQELCPSRVPAAADQW